MARGRILATILALTAMALAVALLVRNPLRDPFFGNGGPSLAQRERVTYASVVVTPPTARQRVVRVQLSPQDAILTPGQRFLFTAVALSVEGEPVPTVQLQWRVKDPDTGSITSTGLFTAGETPGTYLDAVEVSVISEQGTVSSTAIVDIVSHGDSQTRRLDTVLVYPSDITVKPGQVVGLGALGWNSRGQLVQGVQLDWSMSTPQAGSVDQFGFFKASQDSGRYPEAIQVKATQETSTGTIERQSFISVTVTENIQRGVLSQVVVVPGAVTLTPGQRFGFIARAFDQSGQPVSKVSFAWEVTQPEAGTMEGQGYFVANSEVGEFPDAIQAVATQETPQGPVRASASITVTVEPPRTERKISRAQPVPKEISLRPGQRFLFAVYGLDADGVPVRATATWELVDPSAGSMSQAGVFVSSDEPGIYEDAVRVRLTQEDGKQDTVVEAFATVNIVGPLETVEVRSPLVTLEAGQSTGLVAVGYDANGLEIPSLSFRWSMEDPQAGTITQTGLFTAGASPGSYDGAIKVTAIEVGRQ
ncbi:MAG: hypothetical protein HYX93_06790 [Chloroflexi bacterium]|nr:hypothetical protein [Chloroflexota bacterium]